MPSYVYTYRGGVIENRHRVSMAIVKPDGSLFAATGNPDLLAHPRSSAKPFQAQALFLSGAVERFKFSPAEIALACASHDGTLEHISLAQTILEKIGLDASYLACGTHMPSAKETREALQAAKQEPTAIHNNCSGKHSAMLAIALALGASPEGYEKPEHPVQQLNFQTIRDLSGVKDFSFGIDGCSVPAFILPLSKVATMFAQLAVPEVAPEQYQPGLKATYSAMRAHPEMVAGPDSIDTVLMKTIPDFAAKRGAEGYYGMALRDSPHGPLGISLKVEDGNNQVREVFVIALLERLGVLSKKVALPWRKPIIRNHRGIETGYITAELEPFI